MAARAAPLRSPRGFATRPGLCRSYTTTRDAIADTPADLIDRATCILLIEDIRRFVDQEAKEARLPGWANGPADAYRHLIVVEEMTRRFGALPARVLAEINEVMSWARMRRSGYDGPPVTPVQHARGSHDGPPQQQSRGTGDRPRCRKS